MFHLFMNYTIFSFYFQMLRVYYIMVWVRKMEIVKLTPRGYCHGVVDAVKTINKLDTTRIPKPIYILGMLVHNKEIINRFKSKGFITLHDPSKTRSQLLDQIDTLGTVILTAHGTAPSVIQKARRKGLHIIDTTCSDVTKTKLLIEEHLDEGYHVLYIGKEHHPESESMILLNPKKVHLISSLKDIATLKINKQKLLLTNQTTMSFYDVFHLTEAVKKTFPTIKSVDEICDATRVRQEAVANQDKDIEFCFVVGDKLSNNSNNLVNISMQKANIKSILIETVNDIDVEQLKTLNKVSITSGASTPTHLTNQVIEFLEQFDKNNPKTWNKS